MVAAAVDRRVWRLQSLWMLSPVVVPMFLLAFGIVFRNAGTWAQRPEFVVARFAWLLLPLGFVLLASFRSVAGWSIVLGILPWQCG